jgi:glycosyltransferase involved in cell wall biosynthesis
MYRRRSIGVVVPAYNEELLIAKVIETMPAYVDRIYVIDDCSTDRTFIAAARFSKEPRLKLTQHLNNKGVGAAIMTGYKQALSDEVDIVAVMAGDNQMDPIQLTKLLDPLVEGDADYCKGDRLSRSELTKGMSRWRRFGNQILTRLTRISSGYWKVQDPQNGYTAISREALSRLDLDKVYPRYGYCNDLLAKLNVLGVKVKDVQIPARYGHEKSKIKYGNYIRKVSLLLLKNFFWRITQKTPQFLKTKGAKTRTTEVELYDNFVDSSPQGSLFHKSWWLDTVAPNKYTILSIKRNEEILAAWPITFKKLAGLNLIMLPQLTPKLGIMFAPPLKLKYPDQLSEEIDLMAKLLKLLPKHTLFYQRFPTGFTNWLPLYWANFKQTTRYTYVIEDLSDLNIVWENIRYSTKRKIKRALKHGIKVVTDLGLEKLLDLNELTYNRQKLTVPYSREHVQRIDEACEKYNAGKKFFAIDAAGQIHAAVYIVYDQKAAYYLIGGGDPTLNNYGAHFLALWEAIKFASQVSQSFDFEGSMHSNIEPVFRGFGGVQKPYMEITRGNYLIESAFNAFRNAWNKGGILSVICSKLLR